MPGEFVSPGCLGQPDLAGRTLQRTTGFIWSLQISLAPGEPRLSNGPWFPILKLSLGVLLGLPGDRAGIRPNWMTPRGGQ
jgi:hypothetical protein